MADQKTVQDRKRRIVEMLKSCDHMSLSEIGEALATGEGAEEPIKKGAVNKYIESLRDEGYTIESFKNIGLKLIQDDSKFPEMMDGEYMKLDTKVIERWIILFMLSRSPDKYMDVADIKDIFRKEYFYITDYGFSDCLNDLKELHYITELNSKNSAGIIFDASDSKPPIKKYYSVTETAPMPAFLNMDDIFCFSDFCSQGGEKRELGSVVESIIKKIKAVFPGFDNESEGYEVKGRKNTVEPEIRNKLNAFLQSPFKTKALNIKYCVDDSVTDIKFKTGIIVFCVDKNAFYALGEAEGENVILRIDKIQEINEDAGINDIYDKKSKVYKKFFEEAWSVSVEKPEEVEVWFEDIPHVREKVKRLQNMRSATAKIVGEQKAAGKDWMIYRDNIVGVSDALPFIRSMGSSAVVVKPESIRHLMTEKTKELIEKYEELK